MAFPLNLDKFDTGQYQINLIFIIERILNPYLATHDALGPLPRAQVELPQLLEQRLTLGPELVSLHVRIIAVYQGVVSSKRVDSAFVMHNPMSTPGLGFYITAGDNLLKCVLTECEGASLGEVQVQIFEGITRCADRGEGGKCRAGVALILIIIVEDVLWQRISHMDIS